MNELRRDLRMSFPSTEAWRRDLEKIKKQGIGFCQEEIDIGINAIGVPIFNHKNEPAASIVTIGPSPRIQCKIKSPIVAELRKAAFEIAAQLFHNENP